MPTLETAHPGLDSPARRFARTNARSVADGIVSRRAHSRRAAGRARRLAFGIALAPARCGAAERQLAAATANIGVAKADLFPKFYLTGVAGFESVSASDWFDGGSRFWSVGPTVQWRIFDAGRIRANIKVQNARQEQALATYEQTALTAFEDVENALVAYAKEQVRRRSLEDAVTSSQESLRLANQLYANGLSDFINVLDAERSLYQAQDALVQSDRTVSANLIALYKSLGGGWETPDQQSQLAQAKTTN